MKRVLVAAFAMLTIAAGAVAAEKSAAKLDDHRCVLRAGELVIEPDAVAHLRERHLSPP